MTTSRVAVLREPPQPVETWSVEVPEPMAGEVRVQITMGGICGTDVHLRRGDFPLPFPIVLGHEGVGTLTRLGDGVEHDFAGVPVAVGDLVYWCPIPPCHHCYYCTVEKDFSSCQATWFHHAEEPGWASYADLATLPPTMTFFRVPDGTSAEAVIALGCALPAVLQGFDRLQLTRTLESVVIQGAGPIGLSAIIAARQRGARRVIVIDQHDNRLQMATRMGATDVISLDEPTDARKLTVEQLCGERGPQLVVEAAGAISAFPEGIDLAGHNGMYLLIGLWSGAEPTPIDPSIIIHKNLRVVGTCYAQPEHYFRAMMLAAQLEDELPLKEIVSHRFALESANAALDTVARGDAIKAVIEPTLAR